LLADRPISAAFSASIFLPPLADAEYRLLCAIRRITEFWRAARLT
jgi:hypothetical protein